MTEAIENTVWRATVRFWTKPETGHMSSNFYDVQVQITLPGDMEGDCRKAAFIRAGWKGLEEGRRESTRFADALDAIIANAVEVFDARPIPLQRIFDPAQAK